MSHHEQRHAGRASKEPKKRNMRGIPAVDAYKRYAAKVEGREPTNH